MSVKRELIKGTLILTAAGFAARLLGFFNRVYLANLISNAELGRYQLIFPIFMFCMAVSCAGIQVAVSKMVAAYHGTGKKKAIRQTIKSAGIMSLIVALLSSGCVIAFSEPISRWILKDISCRGYLVIMAICHSFCSSTYLCRRLFLWYQTYCSSGSDAAFRAGCQSCDHLSTGCNDVPKGKN